MTGNTAASQTGQVGEEDKNRPLQQSASGILTNRPHVPRAGGIAGPRTVPFLGGPRARWEQQRKDQGTWLVTLRTSSWIGFQRPWKAPSRSTHVRGAEDPTRTPAGALPDPRGPRQEGLRPPLGSFLGGRGFSHEGGGQLDWEGGWGRVNGGRGVGLPCFPLWGGTGAGRAGRTLEKGRCQGQVPLQPPRALEKVTSASVPHPVSRARSLRPAGFWGSQVPRLTDQLGR